VRLKFLKETWDVLSTVLKWPLLVTLFAFNAFVVIPFAVMSITQFGFIGFILLIAVESPLFFLAIREARRQWKIQPAIDRWETSLEKWNEAVNDYVKMVDDEN
jgi:hypothetical protein